MLFFFVGGCFFFIFLKAVPVGLHFYITLLNMHTCLSLFIFLTGVSKRVSVAKIDDVAKLAGVSPATVSRVMNGTSAVKASTRQKVEAALDQLSYRPSHAARALARTKKISLGLVVATFSEPFFMSLTESIVSFATENDLNLTTAIGGDSAEGEAEAIDTLRSQGCKAIVMHSKYLSDERLSELLNTIPGLVLLNRLVFGFEDRCVWLDNKAGAEKMVRRLYYGGHRQFACINRAEKIDDSLDRFSGWQKALQEFDVTLNEASVAEADCTLDGGYQAVNQLLAAGASFTALLCYDDSMAFGAIRALTDAGLNVPKDVSIVGFNDSYMARTSYPKLTTMHYPVEQMALEAGRLALKCFAGDNSMDSHIGRYLPVVIARQSDRRLAEVALS